MKSKTIKAKNAVEWHTEIAIAFDEKYSNSQNFKERYTVWTNMLDKYSNKNFRAADLGCGSGVFTLYLAGRNKSVVGIDASAEMLKICNKKKEDKGINNLDLLNCKIDSMGEVLTEKVDLITASSVFEYLDDLDGSLELIARNLKKKGLLIFSMPNKGSFYRKMEPIFYKVASHPKYYKHVKNVCTLEEMKKKLHNFGFDVLESQYYSKTPFLSKALHQLGFSSSSDNLFIIVARLTRASKNLKKLGINAFNIGSGGGIVHLVELLTAAEPLNYNFSGVTVWGGSAILKRLPDRDWLSKVEVQALNKGWLHKLWWNFVNFPKMIKQYDLLFVPGGSYLGRFKPFINMFQNVLPFESTEVKRYFWKSPKFYIKWNLLRIVQNLTFKKAQGSIFPSLYAKELIYRGGQQRKGQPYAVVSHGINSDFKCIERENVSVEKLGKTIQLLYISTIDLYKHQWQLVKAVQLLRQKGIDIRLTLVGQAANKKALSMLKTSMSQVDPLGEYIDYLGSIDHSELPKLYRKADIFVFPSTCESISNIVLEAMASSLPIACSSRSVMPQILKDAGVYFDPENVSSIAEAINLLIQDEKLRTRCAEKAYQYSLDYNWKLCADQTFSFFKKIANDSTGGELHRTNKIKSLDACLFPLSVRIKVLALHNLEEVQAQYFIRKKSMLKVYYYIKEIGLKPTVEKICSRWRERFRNEKYISIGVGQVLEPEATVKSVQKEEMVFFIATNHPACEERVVVHKDCVFSMAEKKYSWLKEDELVYFKTQLFAQEKWWTPLLGWLPFSGAPLPMHVTKDVKEKIEAYFDQVSIQEARFIALAPNVNCQEKSEPLKQKKLNLGSKTAVLFGLGNYAKTSILPNINKNIKVTKIHELDPLQMLPLDRSIGYDTSPSLRGNEDYDVCFVAGYHHTHANIAIEGLKKNMDIVLEKPLVTTREDLSRLVAAMQQSSARLYGCFQRRYHRFNQLIYKDCQLTPGRPVSYYAIVYEEALPKLHWYRWPNSKSAIISNGCHWVDHFFFLNNYSEVYSLSARKSRNSEVIATIELVNGAVFSLTLSHLGSSRIGMQEYVELRSGDSTVKIMNSSSYSSENNSRILRKTKENKNNAYKRMYKIISNNIVERDAQNLADTWRNVQLVSSAVLSLDEEVGD
jgi:glycosyltransferase involved in cell wall biosynthesis/predicted dehydrogenase